MKTLLSPDLDAQPLLLVDCEARSREALEKNLTRMGIRWHHLTGDEALPPLTPCAVLVELEAFASPLTLSQINLAGIPVIALTSHEGLYQVQDLSSMQVALWSEVKAGDQVLDVCAAPGGKAIHIAELLNGTGHVEARDLTEYKVALIRDNIERSGLTNINAVCQDAAIYDPHKKETADIVIADLPCSGLGVLGKKPDLRYKMNEKTEADLVELQKKILSVVKDYVKSGGKLLYSTCTIHREENEGNVEWFLKEYPEFELVKEKQMIPGRDAGDGFYIAILKRVNHE